VVQKPRVDLLRERGDPFFARDRAKGDPMKLRKLPSFFVPTSPTTLQVKKEDIQKANNFINSKRGNLCLTHENKDVVTEPLPYQICDKDWSPTSPHHHTEILSEVLWDKDTKDHR
jgi:hypothetical protein